jgi:hypothetical protein
VFDVVVKLCALVTRSGKELISTIGEVFNEIRRDRLICVYLSWKKAEVGESEEGKFFHSSAINDGFTL